MELRQLKIFCTAARALNFTRAAAQLGYAQSNITSQIRHLEEELQVKLFERFGRGLQLTNEGKRFLVNAEAILVQCERAKEEFSPDTVRGRLNIGAAETVCVHRLPRILSEYRHKYPQVEIRVQTESCVQLVKLVRKNAVDVALTLTQEVGQPDMAVKTLYNEAMVVVVAPGHPLAGRKDVSPADMAKECLIITTQGCGYRPVIFDGLNSMAVKPGAVMELTSVGAIKECTVCGLGLAVLPRIAVREELRQGRLIELNWQGPEFVVKTQLIYHRDKWLSPAVQAFLVLCDRLGE